MACHHPFLRLLRIYKRVQEGTDKNVVWFAVVISLHNRDCTSLAGVDLPLPTMFGTSRSSTDESTVSSNPKNADEVLKAFISVPRDFLGFYRCFDLIHLAA